MQTAASWNESIRWFSALVTMKKWKICDLTPPRNWRSTVKKSLLLIEMSKLLICNISSRFAKWSFSLSSIQKINFSMFATSFVFYGSLKVIETFSADRTRNKEGKNTWTLHRWHASINTIVVRIDRIIVPIGPTDKLLWRWNAINGEYESITHWLRRQSAFSKHSNIWHR